MTTDDFPCCSRGEHSTPPADDVREALHLLLDEELSDLANRIGREGVRRIADRIADTFEVRPRGTVTDAEVDAAMATLDPRGLGGRNGMRAALEAAQGVRS